MTKNIIFTFAMDRDMNDRLVSAAEQENVSVSEIIRRALDEYLEEKAG